MLCVTPSCVTDRKIKVYLPKIIFIFSISISYIEKKKLQNRLKKITLFLSYFFLTLLKKLMKLFSVFSD